MTSRTKKNFTIDIPIDTPAATFIQFKIDGVRGVLTTMEPGTHRPIKRKKADKHTRTTEINVTFHNPVLILRSQLTMDGRAIEIHGRPASCLWLPDTRLTPGEVEVITYYEGEKKRRPLNAFYFQHELPPATEGWLIARYDRIYGIDTNTVEFADFGTISFTTVIMAKLSPISEVYGHLEGETILQDYRRDVVGNPETSAWRVLVSKLDRERESPNTRIGIIVDSELGSIRDINFRKIPISEGFYLPPNFELIYAADRGGSEEFCVNKIIRNCEANSKRMLSEIERDNNLVRVTKQDG